MSVSKRDLEIYRGTYRECMAQPTVDMKIYLAWDTQEIFIGNSVGTKVPYGNNKVLQKELFEKIKELKDELPDIILNTEVAESLQPKIAELEDELRGNIATELNRRFSTVYEEIESKKSELLGLISNAVDSITDNKLDIDNLESSLNALSSSIEARLNASITTDELRATIEETENNIKDWVNSQSLTDVEEIRQAVDNFFNENEIISLEVEAAASRALELVENSIDEKISSAIEDVQEDIESIQENIENVQEDIERINDRIDNISIGGQPIDIEGLIDSKIETATATFATNSVRFLSGNEIKAEADQLTAADRMSEFKPVFCTETSNIDEYYSAGSIYYYDADENDILKSAGGGGTEKEVVPINLSLTANITSYQINSDSTTVSLTAMVPNNVVNYATNYRIINPDNTTTNLDITSNNSLTVKQIMGFSRNQDISKTYRFTATPIASTKTAEYQVNDATLSINVYTPAQYGIEGKGLTILNSAVINNGSYDFTNLEAGDRIVFYQKTAMNKTFKMGSMEVNTIFDHETETLIVNGVSVLYNKYYYTIGNIADSNTLTIKVL